MWRTIWLGAALALVTDTAIAADAQGRYAAHGLGRTPCARFVEVCEKGAEECKVTATYVAGYVTAFNALNKDTFDILPWQRPELVAEGAFNLCKRNPKVALIEAMTEVVRVLYPQRIDSATDRVQIGDGDDAVYLYKQTVRIVQQRLIDLGLLKGKADGAFGPGSKAALESFQKGASLTVNGVPDQQTLVALLYGGPQPQGGGQGAAAPAQAAPTQAAPAQAAPEKSQPGAPNLNLNLAPGSGLSGN